jgi:hypothetical protein
LRSAGTELEEAWRIGMQSLGGIRSCCGVESWVRGVEVEGEDKAVARWRSVESWRELRRDVRLINRASLTLAMARRRFILGQLIVGKKLCFRTRASRFQVWR